MRYLLKTFFTRNPALQAALFFLFGVTAAFGVYSPLIPASVLLLSQTHRQKVFLIATLLFSFCLSKSLYYFPEETVTGTATVRITHQREAKGHRGWIYRAKLMKFIPDGACEGRIKRIPCSLFSSLKKESGYDYVIHGKLKSLYGKCYSLQTKEKWEKWKEHLSCVERRYQAKKWVQGYFTSMIKREDVAAFLGGLATGEMSDPVLLKDFERRGLSHLLAISGFHFAMIALCFHFIFRIFFPSKITASLLIVLLSLYFLFIGPAPSVQRAYVMAIVAMAGLLVEKRTSGINTLGIALLFGLIVDPLSLFNPGFQLSYLAAAGILFLFGPLERFLKLLFPHKDPLSNFVRGSFALGLAVHLALIPHLLFLFHKMPWHGLLYNLYFPFLVTISLILIIIASLFHLLIPPLGQLLHRLNEVYTGVALDTMQTPLIPHQTWYVGEFPGWMLTLYLTLLFGGAILISEYLKKKEYEDPRLDFHFL